MAVGAAAHRQVQAEVPAETGVQRRTEVPIEAYLSAGRWRVSVQGRIDIVENRPGGTCLIEFKTVSTALPRDPTELERAFPDYFDQLAAYLALAARQPGEDGAFGPPGQLSGELWFEALADGFRQRVSLTPEEAEVRVQNRLAALEPFLEQRWAHAQKLAATRPRPAFAQLRPGQAEALADLETAASAIMCFEAPTGFGKTGIALQDALRRLHAGEATRVIYLSGKSTGQLMTARQLAQMLPDEGGMRMVQLRSRWEHATRCPHACDEGVRCREFVGRGSNACPAPWEVLDAGIPDLETVSALAAGSGHCPYEWTRALLPLAEVWVCDYNYVFAPTPAAVLLGVPGYAPATTHLIVDEAHNLPERVAANYSFEFTADGLAFLLHTLEDIGSPAPLRSSLEELEAIVRGTRPSERLDDSYGYELLDALESASARLVEGPLDWERLGGLAERLFSLPAAARTLAHPRLDRLLYAPDRGRVRGAVLDASPLVAEGLRSFGRAVLMSATLHPREEFAQSCGLAPGEAASVVGRADWREAAYRVAIDTRVDTRLRRRADFYEITAATLLQAARQPPVAVFFPSYHYAETLRSYIAALDPGCQVRVQPRVRELSGQLTFIEESLLGGHLLFFVLGSSFAEGIDHLGGKVERVVVVGPALPEVNAEQRARLDANGHLGKSAAFEAVYLAPALRKVNQALGRLVRAPGQRADVLLHGKRYAENAFQCRLLPEYRGGDLITNEAELAAFWP